MSTISDARRAEILASLASERTRRRGFASAREQQLAERSAMDTTIPRDSASEGISEAVQRATKAAVDDAIARAFASANVPLPPEPPISVPPPRTTTNISSFTTQSHDVSFDSSNRWGATTDPTPLSASIPTIAVPSERDRLVTRLLAERRAILSASAKPLVNGGLLTAAGGGSGSGSATAAAAAASLTSAMNSLPQPPPYIARALELRAANAIAARTHAAALIPPPTPTPPIIESLASTLASSGLGNNEVLLALRAQVTERLRARGGTAVARGVKFASPESAIALTAPVSRSLNHTTPLFTQRDTQEDEEVALEVEASISPDRRGITSPTVRTSSSGGSGGSSNGRYTRPSAELIRKEREAALYGECTFKPRLVSGRSSSNERAASAWRLESLARDQSQIYADRERRKLEAEAERVADECTFQPMKKSRSRSASRGRETDICPEPATRGFDESKAREYLEGNTMTGVAPVAAPINGGGSGQRTTAAVASTRLYLEADRRALKAAQAKAAVERQALAQYTFKPTINATSAAIVANRDEAAGLPTHTHHRPIFERGEEMQRNAQEMLHRLRMETLASGPAAECTFQPRINPASAKLAATTRARGSGGGGGSDLLPGGFQHFSERKSITDRLADEAIEAEGRRAARRMEAARQEAAVCTFAPRISATTEGHVRTQLARLDGKGNAPAASALAALDPLMHDASSVIGGSNAVAADPMSRFLIRQHAMLEAKKRNLEEVESNLRAESSCTFKPDIGNADEVLTLTRPERMLEAQGARVERLGKEEVFRKNTELAKAQETHFSQFSFQPEINAESRARGRAHTIEELKNNERGARAKLKAAAIVEAEFISKHPFRPVLVATDAPPSPGGGKGNTIVARICVTSDPEHVSERVAEVIAAQEAKREAARKRAEFDELKLCTFVPETAVSKTSLAKMKQSAEIDGGVVVVRGLGRHLELKELSRHMEEEKR